MTRIILLLFGLLLLVVGIWMICNSKTLVVYATMGTVSTLDTDPTVHFKLCEKNETNDNSQAYICKRTTIKYAIDGIENIFTSDVYSDKNTIVVGEQGPVPFTRSSRNYLMVTTGLVFAGVGFCVLCTI